MVYVGKRQYRGGEFYEVGTGSGECEVAVQAEDWLSCVGG